MKLLMISIDVQCIGIALLMISIVVQCNRNISAMHWNELLMISIVVQCIGIELLMHCKLILQQNYKHSCAIAYENIGCNCL